ncbi:MAG: hypothetical protein Roseis2KO_35980 [Roseivirga sp.]
MYFYVRIILILGSLGLLMLSLIRKADFHVAYLGAKRGKRESNFEGLFRMMKDSDNNINPLHMLVVILPLFIDSKESGSEIRLDRIKLNIYKWLAVFYCSLCLAVFSLFFFGYFFDLSAE